MGWLEVGGLKRALVLLGGFLRNSGLRGVGIIYYFPVSLMVGCFGWESGVLERVWWWGVSSGFGLPFGWLAMVWWGWLGLRAGCFACGGLS